MSQIKSNVTTVANPTEVVPVVKNITLDQLVEGLMAQRGAKFISFTHDKEPSKMRKTGNPFVGDCFKWQKVSGQLNFHYDLAVLKQLEKEGKSADSFKQGESWHEPIIRADGTLTPFCRSKKDPRKIYLRFRLLNVCDVRFHNAKGETLDADEVRKFIPENSSYSNQGTSETIKFMTWGIDEIKSLTIDGIDYRIVEK